METCTAAASSPHASLVLGACSLKGGVGGSSPPKSLPGPGFTQLYAKLRFRAGLA